MLTTSPLSINQSISDNTYFTMSNPAHPPKTPLTSLPLTHFSAIKQALTNILASKLAIDTYAQVVNGIPVPTAAEKTLGGGWWYADNPHPKPSDEAYQVVGVFQRDFDVQRVEVDSTVRNPTQGFIVYSVLTPDVDCQTLPKRTLRHTGI